MTVSEPAISDHVVVQCPSCGACESVEAAAVADRPAMVCRECGETWPAGPARKKRRFKRRRKRKSENALLIAERQAVVTYSDASDKAWKAKIDGDRWPEARAERRLPMTAAAVAAVLFLGAFFGARENAVAALPDLAGLYAAIGLKVNLDRLAIEHVGAERGQTFEGSRVTVRATLHNLAAAEQTIPPLVAAFNHAGAPLGTFAFDPPSKTIAAGQSISLLVDVDSAPESAEEVELRFPRRGEALPRSGAARLAPE